MLLHIGEDTVLRTRDVVAILDLKSALSFETQAFLRAAQEKNEVRNAGEGAFKALILCQRNGKSCVYYSPISSDTLKKRFSLASANRLPF